MATMGVTRKSPTGIEKFVWDKAKRKLEPVWSDDTVPHMLHIAMVNVPAQSVYFSGYKDGMFSLGSTDKLKANADGTIDLYFGPERPAASPELNWVQVLERLSR
jgi:hypothetical protein